MTILYRAEKPGLRLTVCGMVSTAWFEGLENGQIAKAQGGLTIGQIGWLRTHTANEGRAWESPALFDAEDTGEL